MRILLSGASGLIGTPLRAGLADAGHQVYQLVRRAPAGEHEFRWDPSTGDLDPHVFDGVDAVINLSGAPIISLARRWTRSYIEELYASRLDSTNTLVSAMHRAEARPGVFISQSGANYYGEGGVFSEDAEAGTGILSRLCVQWEAAAQRAPESVRVATMRNGIVFSPRGGALGKLLTPMKLGIGGPLGGGEQYWPWISLVDVCRAIAFILRNPVSGPVNFCSPEQNTVREIVNALGASLRRPARIPVPAPVLRLGLGKAADEMLLASTRLVPEKLQQRGFEFEHATLASVADWVAEQQPGERKNAERTAKHARH